MLENMQTRVNADTALVRRGRWVNLSFLLGIDAEDYVVTIADGKVAALALRGLATDTGCFTIRAARETWEEHWSPMPKRDYHDIWSMLPKGLAKIDGDLLPLMQNLQYFKDVIASPRRKEA